MDKTKLLKLSLVLVICSLFLMHNASAFGFSTAIGKEYISPQNAGEYGTINIWDYNLFTPDTKLAEYKLIENSCSVIDCYAMGTIKTYYDGSLFDNLNLLDRFGRTKQSQNFKFYVLTNESYQEIVPNFKTTCEDLIDSKNGTSYQDCTTIQEGTKTETKTKEYYKEIKSVDVLPAGNYQWKIEAQRKPNEALDWVITAYENELTEWAWWNTTWSNKKQILIQENSGFLLENYTVRLNVTYDSNMQADFDDVRFVNASENAELSYYLVSKVNSASAIFDIKISKMLPSVNTTIYMYYGASSVASTSSFNNAYAFADNFNTNNGAGWTAVSGGWDFTSGYAVGTNAGKLTRNINLNASNTFLYFNGSGALNNRQVRLSTNASCTDSLGGEAVIQFPKDTDSARVIINGTVSGDGSALTPFGFGIYNLTVYGNGTIVGLFPNGNRLVQTGGIGGNTFICLNERDGGGSIIKVEDVYVRPYREPEPTAVFGSEATQSPTVTLNSPANKTNIVYLSSSFNATATTIAGTLTNATVYLWTTGGVLVSSNTVSLTGTTANALLNLSGLSYGNYKWNVLACDNESIEVCGYAPSNFTLNITEFIENSQAYGATALGGSQQDFSINITYNSTFYTNINTYLVYNGTEYLGTQTGTGDTVLFNRTVSLPTSVDNYTFYWKIGLSNSSFIYFNSTSHSQSVSNILVDDCTGYSTQLFNFTMVDEDAQTYINDTVGNTSIKIDMQFKNPTTEVTILNYTKYYNEINPARICTNTSLGSSTYLVDAIIEYSSTGRFLEFYNLDSFLLNTSTTNQNITLYDLSTATGEEFKITYKDENFNTVPGALIHIQRRYIAEGAFKTVELPKVSSAGFALVHLVPNEVSYNLVVYVDGVLEAIFTDINAYCPNPTIADCEININSFSSIVSVDDFTTEGDFVSTLTWNKTSRVVSATFSVPSGTTVTTSLNVTLFDSLGNQTVCNDYLISAGGTLSCVIPNIFGNGTVVAKLYADGTLKKVAYISLAQNPKDFFGANLMFLGIIAVLFFIGVGVTEDPKMLGIMLIIGLIAMASINLITTTSWVGVGATILWFIVAVVVIIIKGSNR